MASKKKAVTMRVVSEGTKKIRTASIEKAIKAGLSKSEATKAVDRGLMSADKISGKKSTTTKPAPKAKSTKKKK